MKTIATFTQYAPHDPEMDGPIGVTHVDELPVEVVGFKHDEFGISAAAVLTKNGNGWWVTGDDLDDILVTRVE